MIHVLHEEAFRELREAVAYDKAIGLEVVADFHPEIERLIHEVCLHLQLYRLFDAPARRHFSNRFPYGIIYLAEPGRDWIVAIMPLKRKPAYWRTRVVPP